MSAELINKQRLVTEFALMVFQSNLTAEKLKSKHRLALVDRKKADDLASTVISNLPRDNQVIAKKIKITSNRDQVLALCENNLSLCRDNRMDNVWKEKIKNECEGRFQNSNFYKFKDIQAFNQAKKTNFDNYFQIYRKCKLTPKNVDDLFGKIFALLKPSIGNTLNFIQIIMATKGGKQLIVRKVPSIDLVLKNGATSFKPHIEWAIKHKLRKISELSKEEKLNNPEYTRIRLNGIIEHYFMEQGFKSWWFQSSGDNIYELFDPMNHLIQ